MALSMCLWVSLIVDNYSFVVATVHVAYILGRLSIDDVDGSEKDI